MSLPRPIFRRFTRFTIPAAIVALQTFASSPIVADDADSEKNIARRNPGASTEKSANGEHPLAKAIRAAQEAEQAARRLKDYSAVFSKYEIVDRTVVQQRMLMKVRHKPFSVYLKFVEPAAGREVIYVAGRNEGNILAHETGLAGLIGTVRLLPTSDRAMQENRYPITDIGMARLAEKIIAQWKTESKYGESEVKFYPKARLGKRACKVIENTHPKPRRQFLFHKTRLYIDAESNLPIRAEQFGFARRQGGEPPLVERYTYTNIRPNVDLTDIDFDENNPKYDY